MGHSSCVVFEGVWGVDARLHGADGNSRQLQTLPSLHPLPLTGNERTGSIAYEVGWALEGTWTFRERK